VIDLQQNLGAPPIVFPGVPMVKFGSMPSGIPGNAHLRPIAATAAANVALAGCVGCSAGSAIAGVGDLAPSWWSRIPTWIKIAGGVGLAGGLAYGVYRWLR
jgi:hypothetical protein